VEVLVADVLVALVVEDAGHAHRRAVPAGLAVVGGVVGHVAVKGPVPRFVGGPLDLEELARGDVLGLLTVAGRARHGVPVAGDDLEVVPVQVHGVVLVGGVVQPHADAVALADGQRLVRGLPRRAVHGVEAEVAAVGEGLDELVLLVGGELLQAEDEVAVHLFRGWLRLGQHHEDALEAAKRLLRPVGVGVIGERADVARLELVQVALARRHGLDLGDAGHPVVLVGHVHAVEVDGGGLVELVLQLYPHRLALVGHERRPRRRAVVAPRPDRLEREVGHPVLDLRGRDLESAHSALELAELGGHPRCFRHRGLDLALPLRRHHRGDEHTEHGRTHSNHQPTSHSSPFPDAHFFPTPTSSRRPLRACAW
jgi:hypothetical protein